MLRCVAISCVLCRPVVLHCSTRLDQRNNRLIYQVDEPNLPTHCQTTSRQLDATRPTQQPAYLSSRPTQLTSLTARQQLDATRPTQQPAYLSRRSTQLTSPTATQHLDSSTRLDQRNNRLIYQVDEPNLPTHCQTTSRQLDATRRNSTQLDQRNNRLIYHVDQPN